MENKFINENLILDNCGRISWKNSIGKIFSVVYEDVKYTFIITKYNSKNRKINFKYYQSGDDTDYSMITSNILKASIGIVIGKYSFDYKYKINDIVNDNKIIKYSKINYGGKYVKSYYVECIHDGYKRDVSENSLNNGCTCPVCTNKIVVRGINDLWTTNPELASLLADPNDGYKYTQSTSKKVPWRCPDCNNITKPRRISNVRNQGLFCEHCSDKRSLPNRIMYNLLSSLDIPFDDEANFDWCKFELEDKSKYGIYDFYFEKDNQKYIVEMDGYWHKNDNLMNGQTADESKYIDDEKDRLAYENDIHVIRIPCIPSRTNVIKENILNSELSNIFDLSSVNWNSYFYKSIKSMAKEVCSDYKNGTTITELVEKYKKDKCTIMKYLDYGTEIGLCSYKHDNNKSHVVCLNDKKYYDMIKDASDVYNVTTSAIQLCCSGKTLNAGNGTDEYGLPLVFAYYDDYIKLNDIDILRKIQESVLFKYFDKMVICLNTKTVFKTTIDAQNWCGCSITANLYEPERHSYSGRHPVTNEKLQWLKLKDYLKSTTSSEVSAFII